MHSQNHRLLSLTQRKITMYWIYDINRFLFGTAQVNGNKEELGEMSVPVAFPTGNCPCPPRWKFIMVWQSVICELSQNFSEMDKVHKNIDKKWLVVYN